MEPYSRSDEGGAVSVDYAAFTAAVDALKTRVHAATADGVEQGADLVKEAVQENLARSHYPPASDPGSPPAMRTGFLREEVYATSAPTETGASAEIWPSTVYARIQELGGIAGKDHRSHLPPRPYVEPALEDSADRFGQIMAKVWAEAIGG